VSAVVFPYHAHNNRKMQDWPRWVHEGWLDALTPIGLGPSAEGVYTDSVNFLKITEGKVPVYPGVFGMYNRLSPAELLSQIDAIHRAGLPGVVLFEQSRLDETYEQALLAGPFRI